MASILAKIKGSEQQVIIAITPTKESLSCIIRFAEQNNQSLQIPLVTPILRNKKTIHRITPGNLDPKTIKASPKP